MQCLRTPPVVRSIAIFAALSILSGCAAVHTSIAKKDLDVQTKMSDTVFLDPVGPDKKTVFVQIRNTSDQSFDIEGAIVSALVARGYRVTQDPDAAHFRLLGNVLSVSKASPTAAEAALASGYGGVFAGGATGAAVGGVTHGWTGAVVGGAVGGILGGLTETVANAAVKDVTYMVVTDIEITEKARPGVIVRQDSQQNASQGMGGRRTQTSSEVMDVKKYRTRIVSTANKANLEYDEAAPQLTQGLIRSVSGLF
ncbi:MAG TPA: complement resistance protein TraT [Candidatus Tectomicrobia bacterium]